MSEPILGAGNTTSSPSSVAGTGLVFTLESPSDPRLVEALGTLVIAHTHLELILRYTVKTLACLTVSEALDATSEDRISDLRNRIQRLFKERKPTEREKAQLDALLHRAKQYSDNRNTYIHSTWSTTDSGQALMKGADHRWGPAPTPAEVAALTDKIRSLRKELDQARRDGFIAQVVQRHKDRARP